MLIASNQVVNKIYQDFPKIYRWFSSFVDSGPLWNACVESITDTEMLNLIVKCNDILKMPPTETFLIAMAVNDNTNLDIFNGLTNHQKRGIGAFWAFVFKYVLQYQRQKESNPIDTLEVATATYFFNPQPRVQIIDNNTGTYAYDYNKP